MHKRNRSTTKSENSQTYQLYNYDSLEWSWAHYTIIITLILCTY